jgi:hypothetical protein
MGFAWMPDKRAGAFGDLYRDNERVGRRNYRKTVAAASAGRHAQSHGQRRLLASFGAARLVPLGRSGSARPGAARRLGRIGLDGRASGARRGAHAARLPDVPRRTSGRSRPERWRRWA